MFILAEGAIALSVTHITAVMEFPVLDDVGNPHLELVQPAPVRLLFPWERIELPMLVNREIYDYLSPGVQVTLMLLMGNIPRFPAV